MSSLPIVCCTCSGGTCIPVCEQDAMCALGSFYCVPAFIHVQVLFAWLRTFFVSRIFRNDVFAHGEAEAALTNTCARPVHTKIRRTRSRSLLVVYNFGMRIEMLLSTVTCAQQIHGTFRSTLPKLRWYRANVCKRMVVLLSQMHPQHGRTTRFARQQFELD